MLSTLLVGARWLPITALLVFAVLGPLLGALLARRPRACAALLAGSLVAVVALTLTPDGDPSPAVACTVQLPYLSATSVESLANVLLLAPTALLAGVLLRRPVVAAGGAVLLSAAIEAVQAVLPGIGRACDTGDLLTNALGAALGGALAAVALRLDRRRARGSGAAGGARVQHP